jgi:Tfp pilus assembly protein PilN
MSMSATPQRTDDEVMAPRRLEGPVRVNLLPQATKERDRASRQRVAFATAGLALLAVLGGAYWWQSDRVAQVHDELAVEQEQLAALQSDLAQLHEFETLEARLHAGNERIMVALGDEASVAGILQDIAAVMPADAQLEQLSVAIAGGDPAVDGTAPAAVGSFTAVGKTLFNHAPGVERLLLELDKVVAFEDLFVSNSRLDDPDEPYATFTVEARLGQEVQTGRYHDGVPEELR